MKERCKRPHRHRVVNEMQNGRLSPLRGLSVEPPPKEKGTEPLYRVVYVIDVNAMNPRQAADRAYEIMRDPQSIRPVLDIIDSGGWQTRVDLSDD